MPTLPMFVLGHLVVPNSGSGHEAAVVPNPSPGHEAANHRLMYHLAMVVLEERAVELPWRGEAASLGCCHSYTHPLFCGAARTRGCFQ
jgi:hypothetical protein